MVSSESPDQNESDVLVVYDGDCPFCSRYVSMLRLREVAGDVSLIDARSGLPLANWARSRFDLDEGMAVRLHGEWFLGGDAINALALVTGPSSILNRINYLLFRNRRISRVIYPLLKGGRNIVLRLIGRRSIADEFEDKAESN